MEITLSHLLKMFAGLLSIVNPVGSVPIFLSLSGALDPEQRHRCARTAALAMAVILSLSAVAGNDILGFFGISIASFKVAGGILILLMAISMLHARTSHVKHTPDEAEEAQARQDSIGVVPLAMPLLAGPGAISTVIVYANDAMGANGSKAGLWDLAAVEAAILLVCAITWIMLRLAVPVGERLGATGINVASRIMGLILAAIAVEFMASGLKGLFPGL